MALTGLTLLLLACLMGRLTRDALHPGLGFAAVWGLSLLLIEAGQASGYYPVQLPALMLFLVGGLAFAAGAWQGSSLARPGPPAAALELPLQFGRLALCIWLLHALLLPLWWWQVQAVSGGAEGLLALAFQLRSKAVDEGLSVGPIAGNYLVLGLILIPVLALGVQARRLSLWHASLLSLPWLATNLLTNGRAPLVLLFGVLIYLRLLDRRRLPLKALFALLLLLLAFFAAGAVLVGKEGIDVGSEPAEIAGLVLKNLADYALQGPILFSAYFEQSHLVNPSWDPLRVPCLALQSLGLCEAGPLHQDYLPFGSGERMGNVYSVYFSTLPAYGVLGTLFFLALYGLWAGWHHAWARGRRSLLHTLLAAHLAAAVWLSIFLDAFLPQLNFLAKLVLVLWLLPKLFGRQAAPHACPA